MNNDLKDAEQVLRSRLGFAGQGAKSLPDIDCSKELLHSHAPSTFPMLIVRPRTR